MYQVKSSECLICPECYCDALVYKVFEETICVYTGDDEYDPYETIKLEDGWIVHCPMCDFADCEPPQY